MNSCLVLISLSVFVAVFNSTRPCLALKCFVCLHDHKGPLNPNCLTVESSGNEHGFQTDCPDLPSTNPRRDTCSYIKITNPKGEVIVMERACGVLEEIYTLRLGCKTVIGPTYSTTGCLCASDGCNGSTSLKLQTLVSAAAAAASMVLVDFVLRSCF